MLKRASRPLLAGAVAALSALTIVPAQPASAGTYPHAAAPGSTRPLPAIPLKQPGGKDIRLDQLRGKWLFIYFGYTHCPSICPTDMAYLASEVHQLGKGKAKVQAIFVSVDPDRDSPEQATAYAKAFAPGFWGLTGTEANLQSYLRQMGGSFVKEVAKPEAPDVYNMAHSTWIYVVDPQGHHVATYAGDGAKGALASDFRFLSGRKEK
jgi:protein SCO1/2